MEMEDGDNPSPTPSTASVLAARFGLRRRRKAADEISFGDDDMAGMSDDASDAGEGGRSKRLAALAFPVVLAVVVLGLAGIVVWLSLTAEKTVQDLSRRSLDVAVPVTLADGTPRFGEAAAPVEEREVDPVDLPVTLAPSRNDALLERGRAGLLPKVGPDGAMAWQAYARPFPQDDPRPRIAIVLGELGPSRAATDAAKDRLPGAVSFAFAAGVAGLQEQIDLVRADGHEVLLSLPMEPAGYPANDPGPGTLLTTLSDERNVQRLETALASATGYVGATTVSGSRFTTAGENLRPILQQAQRRGLVWVDPWLVAQSQGTKLSTQLGLPRAVADVTIDRVPSAPGIDAQLAELERLAKANGAAVGFGQPLPVTIERLASWSAGLRDRGIVLAPVTAVLNRQADR